MSIEIKIVLPDEQIFPKALDDHLETLGFVRAHDVAKNPIWQNRPELTDSDAVARATEALNERVEKLKAEPAKNRGRKKAEEAKPAISTTPEDRRPPEDDEATQTQDAADEAAEVEAAREPETPITVEDLRAVMGEYVNKFTLAATQEDGPLLFASVLGAPPAGEPSWKLSLLEKLPQEKLRAALEAWQAAVNSGQRYRKKG